MQKDWIVGSFIQTHLDFFRPDKYSGRRVNEFSKDDLGATIFIAPEMLCEYLICCLANQGEQDIKVNSDGYRRRQRVGVKEGHCVCD